MVAEARPLTVTVSWCWTKSNQREVLKQNQNMIMQTWDGFSAASSSKVTGYKLFFWLIQTFSKSCVQPCNSSVLLEVSVFKVSQILQVLPTFKTSFQPQSVLQTVRRHLPKLIWHRQVSGVYKYVGVFSSDDVFIRLTGTVSSACEFCLSYVHTQ